MLEKCILREAAAIDERYVMTEVEGKVIQAILIEQGYARA